MRKRLSLLLTLALILQLFVPITSNVNAEGETNVEPQIVGTVVDPNGNPVTGGYVELRDIKGFVNSYYLDSNGLYRIELLEDGSYKLLAHPKSDSEFTRSKEVEIEIKNGELVGDVPILQLTEPQIVGTVVDPNDNPVTEGSVKLLELNGSSEHYRLDQNGQYRIGSLHDGIYKLIAYPNSNSTFTKSREVTIVIRDGQLDGIQPILQITEPQLIGNVVDFNNNAVTDAEVMLKDMNGYSEYYDLTQNGEYIIGGLEDGIYKLIAYPTSNGIYTPSKEVTFEIQDGKLVGDVPTLQLTEPQIVGSVLNPDDTIASNTDVFVRTASGVVVSYTRVINGIYSLGALEDGIYILSAEPYTNNIYTISNEVEIEIFEGKLVGNPPILRLTEPQIVGTVLNPNNSLALDTQVTVRTASRDYVTSISTTNATFRIGGLEDGIYFLQAIPYSYDIYTESEEVEIQIIEGKFTGTNPTLILTEPKIIGTVINPNNTLAYYARVDVRTVTGEHVTDIPVINGTFRLNGLEDGIYKLIAQPSPASIYTQSKEITIEIIGGKLADSNLVLQLTKPQLIGTVVDPYGKTITESYVMVEEIKGGGKSFSIDQYGQYKIGALEDGMYKLVAYPFSDSVYNRSKKIIFEIKDEKLVGTVPVLQLTEPQLIGTILDPNGNIVTDAYVLTEDINGNKEHFLLDENGNYKVGPLEDGTYNIIAMPYSNSTYTRSKIALIEIMEGKLVGTIPTFKLTEPQLVGTIIDPNSNTVTNASVKIIYSNGNYENYSLDQNGQYKIGALEDGTYKIYAYPYSDSEFVQSKEDEIVISEGKLVGSTPTLQLTEPQLVGTVLDPNGIIFTNGYIVIEDMSGHGRGYNLDENGQYKIGALEDGIYKIYVMPYSDSDYTQSKEVTIEINEGKLVGSTPTLQLTEPQIVGTVVNPDNTLATNTEVVVITPSGSTVTYVKVYNGSYNIGFLEDGKYKLIAVPSPEGIFTQSKGAEIEIINGELIGTIPTLQLTEPQLEGIVLDPNDQLFSDGLVEIRDINGYSEPYNINSKGQYKIGALEDGTYKLYAFPFSNSEYSKSDEVTFVISDGELVGTAPTLQLKAPQIVGTVTNPDSEILESGVYIEVRDVNDNWVTGVGLENSKFKLDSLVDGTYTLVAHPYSESEYTKSKELTIQIADGKLVGSAPTLQLTHPQIVGVVTNPDNSTAIDAEVVVRTNNGSFVTNTHVYNGSYKIGGLEDGVYKLIANPSHTGNFTESEEVTFEISDGKLAGNAPILKLTEPQLVGLVLDPDGSPFNNGYVEVRDSNGYGNGYQLDLNGQYKIGALDDGIYTIVANPHQDSNFTKSKEVTFEINDGKLVGTAPTLKLTVPQIVGTVEDPNGNAVTEGYVSIINSNGRGESYSLDEQGNYKIGALEDGVYLLFASSFDGQYTNSKEVVINIEEGKLVGTVPTLKLSLPQIIGTVKDPNGNAVTRGYVMVEDISGRGKGYSIDQDGQFRIGNLADGLYKIYVYPGEGFPYGKSKEVTVTITGGIADNSNLLIELTEPQIKGFVKNPDNSTAPYGYVQILDENDEWVGGSEVNGKGEFFIGGLEDGTYTIQSYPNGDSSKYTPSQKKEIVIKDGIYSGESVILTLTEPQLKGYVTSPDGTPVSNVWVELRDMSGRGMPGVHVDNYGQFSLGNLKDGTYRLIARPFQDTKYSVSNEVIIEIKEGKYVGEGPVNLQLTSPQVFGKVLGPDGENISHAWINIRNSAGYPLEGAEVNSLGNFAIGGLADGTYILKALPEWGSELTPSTDIYITISDGKYQGDELNIYLTEPQLEGMVTDPSGQPHGRGYVEIQRNDGRYIEGSAINELGRFYISGLTDGTYYIKARPDSTSVYTDSPETEIVISNGKYEGELINLALTSPKITGKVLNPDGSPAKRTYVQVSHLSGRWITSVETDKNGTFRIGSLPEGSYLLKAYPNDASIYSSPKEIEIKVDQNGELIGEEPIIVLTEPQLKGMIKGPNNELVSYGWVEVRRQNGEWIEGVGANYSGLFNIANLEDGQYILRARPSSGSQFTQSKEYTIEINDGKYEGQLVLNLNNSQVNGTVKGPNGETIQSGYLEIRDSSNQWITSEVIEEFGKFRIGGLEDGTYYIQAYPDWYSEYSRSDVYQISIQDGQYVGEQLLINLSAVLINGVVKNPKGETVEYGWLGILKQTNDGNWMWDHGVSIDHKGEFKLGSLENGTYRLIAFPDDGTDYTSSDYLEIVVSDEGVIYPESAMENNKLTIYLLESQIKGTVKDPNGEKITNGWVEVRDENNNFILGTGLDMGGNFTIGGLIDGNYKLVAYPDQRTNLTSSKTFNISITNGVSNIDSVELKLNNVIISGTVKAPNNDLVTESWVEIFTNDGEWVGTVNVDMNGNFKLGALDDGEYVLQAFVRPDSKFANSNKVTITISNGEVTTGEIILNLLVPQIGGTVVNTDNVAVSNGWVEVADASGNWILSVPIGSDGTFKLSALDAGKYYVQAFTESNQESDIVELTIDEDGYSPNPLTLIFGN